MRSVLAWLLMVGVVAGLSTRALPASGLGGHDHGHGDAPGFVGGCGHGHHHDPAPGGQDDRDRPDHPCHDPHHHHACCSPASISSEAVLDCRLSPPGGVLLGFADRREPVPDSPYLEREEPPLI